MTDIIRMYSYSFYQAKFMAIVLSLNYMAQAVDFVQAVTITYYLTP